ncbi:MAG: hypothetical protein N2C14_22130 [Planctomycetales bacterium]
MDAMLESFARKKLGTGADYLTVMRELINMGVTESGARDYLDSLEKTTSVRGANALPLPGWVYVFLALLMITPIPIFAALGTDVLGWGLYGMGWLCYVAAILWILQKAATVSPWVALFLIVFRVFFWYLPWMNDLICLLYIGAHITQIDLKGWKPLALFLAGWILPYIGAEICHEIKPLLMLCM